MASTDTQRCTQIEIFNKRGILFEYKSLFFCGDCLPRHTNDDNLVIHRRWQDGLKITCQNCSKDIS